jgi:SWI/SNF related-matrix-associated actin-dependent regulator of chromatin subfamily C
MSPLQPHNWPKSEAITCTPRVIAFFLSLFEHVVSDPPTAKSLSQLISQVIQFQEDNLGKAVKSPPFVRLPVRHFLNFLPDGPLCRILATMYKFKFEQGWRRFDLSSPSRKETNMQMCQKMEEALIEHELDAAPKLFLMDDLEKEDVEKAKKIAESKKFTIVDSEEDATHILHERGDADADAYCRPVFKKGEKCLIHFYRFPVSFRVGLDQQLCCLSTKIMFYV